MCRRNQQCDEKWRLMISIVELTQAYKRRELPEIAWIPLAKYPIDALTEPLKSAILALSRLLKQRVVADTTGVNRTVGEEQ